MRAAIRFARISPEKTLDHLEVAGIMRGFVGKPTPFFKNQTVDKCGRFAWLEAVRECVGDLRRLRFLVHACEANGSASACTVMEFISGSVRAGDELAD